MQISVQQLFFGQTTTKLLALGFVLVLMLVNWGLEARKWQLLVAPLERISYWKAFFAILSGVSLSINTPNRIGEYGGRILYLRNVNKLRAISVTLIGSFSQLIVTLVFGIAGLIYYISHFEFVKSSNYFAPNFWERIVLVMLFILAGLGILLYFRIQVVVSFFRRIPLLRRFRAFVLVFMRFSFGDLWKLLVFSFLRYMVFSAQYLILLQVLDVEILWWQGFLMICLVYLVLALIPTIAIAELGIRGQVSLYFLGLLSSNKIGIIAATLGIWLINLIVPAVLGSLLLLRVKVFNNENNGT